MNIRAQKPDSRLWYYDFGAAKVYRWTSEQIDDDRLKMSKPRKGVLVGQPLKKRHLKKLHKNTLKHIKREVLLGEYYWNRIDVNRYDIKTALRKIR